MPDLIRITIGDIPIYTKNSWRCRLGKAAPLYAGVVNIYSMAAIAVARYVVVVQPKKSSWIKDKRSYFIITLIIWVIPFVIVLPPVIGFWGKYTYFRDIGVCFSIYFITQDLKYKSYFFFLSSFGIIIPTLTMIMCYTSIYLAVRESRRRLARHSNNSFNQVHPEAANENGNSSKKLKRLRKCKHGKGSSQMLRTSVSNDSSKSSAASSSRSPEVSKQELKLTATLALIFISYLVTYIPYTISMIINFFLYQPEIIQLQFGFLFVSYTGNAINPIIFYKRDKRFRQLVLSCLEFFIPRKRRRHNTVIHRFIVESNF
ncbi:G-protein coupled receptor moody [Trichoplax sp. H2]|nr:G-protein coupled receptor moody [Trichoplax sp. H2]|eukprot:RDD38564.1 G-protein coupled receptor moody [Trichoplax sp. H2]